MGISVSKWVVFGARIVLYFRYFRVVLIASLGALIFGIFDIFDNAHFHRSTLCFSVFSFIIRSAQETPCFYDADTKRSRSSATPCAPQPIHAVATRTRFHSVLQPHTASPGASVHEPESRPLSNYEHVQQNDAVLSTQRMRGDSLALNTLVGSGFWFEDSRLRISHSRLRMTPVTEAPARTWKQAPCFSRSLLGAIGRYPGGDRALHGAIRRDRTCRTGAIESDRSHH